MSLEENLNFLSQRRATPSVHSLATQKDVCANGNIWHDVLMSSYTENEAFFICSWPFRWYLPQEVMYWYKQKERFNCTENQIKSNQITFIVTSPQHKCLGEWNSYERAPDSAEKQQTIYLWTDSAKKTKKNKKQKKIKKINNKQFTYGQTVQTANNLHMDRQCKKTALEHLQCSRQCKKNNNSNLHMDRQCKKTALEHLQCSRQCKKNNNSNLHMDRQCKKTTAIYIWTVHIYRLYRRQCAKYTYIYSVRLVYYKDILNYQRHIIHRMGTSTLCTVSIHNVVYA